MSKTKTKPVLAKQATVAAPAPLPAPAGGRLVTFKKVVVRPGTYEVSAGKNGRIRKTWTDESLQKLADTINAQVAAGHKVPAPYKHYVNGKLVVDGELLDGTPSDKLVWDASINAGFWQNAQFVPDASQIDPSFKPGPALVAELQTPGDPHNPNSPAGKIGTTLQETSIAVLPDVSILPKFADGKGDSWSPYVAHIAVPVHAIEPGQDNFALAMSAEESPLCFSVSDMIAEPNSDASSSRSSALSPEPSGIENQVQGDERFTNCLNLLRQACQLDLPPETTSDNFIEVLNIALRQKIADAQQSQQAKSSITTPPAGASSRPSYVAMSSPDSDLSVTDQPATMASEESMVEDPRLTAIITNQLKHKKAELKSRSQNLVASGIFDQTYVDKHFMPEIDAVTMSAEDIDADGEFRTPFIERVLNHAEVAASRANKVLTMSALDMANTSFGSIPDQAVVLNQPQSDNSLPEEYYTEILDRALGGTRQPVAVS